MVGKFGRGRVCTSLLPLNLVSATAALGRQLKRCIHLQKVGIEIHSSRHGLVRFSVRIALRRSHVVYRYPLHISPFSLFASSSVANTPLIDRMRSVSFDPLPITSSLSPLSRFLFSRRRRNMSKQVVVNPIAMYARTIPCPRGYHGVSLLRY